MNVCLILAAVFLLPVILPIFLERETEESNMSVESLEPEVEKPEFSLQQGNSDEIDLVNFNLEVFHEAV